MSDPIETIAEVIGGVDYDYEQRDQARRIVIAIRTSLPLRRSLWLALTADKFATIADLWDVIEANGATNSRLMRERDEARAEVERLKDLVAAREVSQAADDRRSL